MLKLARFDNDNLFYVTFCHFLDAGYWDGECLIDAERILKRAGIDARYIAHIDGPYLLAPDYLDADTMEAFFEYSRAYELDACDLIEANIPAYYKDDYYDLLAQIESDLPNIATVQNKGE